MTPMPLLHAAGLAANGIPCEWVRARWLSAEQLAQRRRERQTTGLKRRNPYRPVDGIRSPSSSAHSALDSGTIRSTSSIASMKRCLAAERLIPLRNRTAKTPDSSR